MAKWYECKVKYPKPGQPGKVTETYLVDALSFTEAEAKIIHEIMPYSVGGDLTVTGIKPSKTTEVFFTGAITMAIQKQNSEIEKAIINRDGKKLDKRDPLVLALKSWVDEEYDGGRQTALTNEELESKSLALAGQLADGDEYAFLLARASKEQK